MGAEGRNSVRVGPSARWLSTKPTCTGRIRGDRQVASTYARRDAHARRDAPRSDHRIGTENQAWCSFAEVGAQRWSPVSREAFPSEMKQPPPQQSRSTVATAAIPQKQSPTERSAQLVAMGAIAQNVQTLNNPPTAGLDGSNPAQSPPRVHTRSTSGCAIASRPARHQLDIASPHRPFALAPVAGEREGRGGGRSIRHARLRTQCEVSPQTFVVAEMHLDSRRSKKLPWLSLSTGRVGAGAGEVFGAKTPVRVHIESHVPHCADQHAAPDRRSDR